MQKLQTMLPKLENSLKSFRDGISEFIKSIKEIDQPPVPNFEILVLNRNSRNCIRKQYYEMREAMSSVTPAYLIDTENEYFLVNTSSPEHKIIKLNKLETNGKNERSIHAQA